MIPVLGQPDTLQGVGQILQESLLGGCGKGFDAQSPGIGLAGRNLRRPIGAHIGDELVEVVLLPLPMEPLEIFPAGEDNQTVLGPGGSHIDQLLIVLQPPVGSLPCLVGKRRGKENHILLIPLKGVDRTAGYLLYPRCLQLLIDQIFLIHERRNNADALVGVPLYIIQNSPNLLRRCVPLTCAVIFHVHIDQGPLLLTLGADVQL